MQARPMIKIMRRKNFVRRGIRTPAHIRGPECSYIGKRPSLESGALDRSAILTYKFGNNYQNIGNFPYVM